MDLALWPLVERGQLIQAFRPGEANDKEGPFRTLRNHGWATAGVSVQTRRRSHASGRTSLFSVLNIAAARSAREGRASAAKSFAQSAARIERGPSFGRIRELLTGKSPREVELAVTGASKETSPELQDALRGLARETSKVSTLSAGLNVVAGKITESQEDQLVLELGSGGRTLVPRWLAHSARRENVGDLLALVTDQLDGSQMIIRAVPAIDLSKPTNPFDRSARIKLTDADARLLSRAPKPLRILVPVTIHE